MALLLLLFSLAKGRLSCDRHVFWALAIACMFKAYTGRKKFSDKLIFQLFGGVHCMECLLFGDFRCMECPLYGDVRSMECPLYGDVRSMECPLYGDVRSMECPLYGDVHCMEVFTHKKNLRRDVSQ